MLFMNISFLPWLFLALFFFGGLLAFTYFRRKSLLKKTLSTSVRAKLFRSFVPGMRPLKLLLLLGVLGMLLFTLLDPRGRALESDISLKGVDLALVYDVSRSMDVQDVVPSRLEAAKAAGEKLVDGLVGNRIGLVAFAADAFRLLPLTTDIDAVKLFIQDLNTGMIGSQSTDIAKALNAALESFSEETLTYKVVVLFTDGENLDGDPAQAVDDLKKKGISLIIVGTGTEQGGSIPVYDDNEELLGTLRDLFNKEVISKADMGAMKSLAQAAGGHYYSTTDSVQIADRIEVLQKTDFGTGVQSLLEPKFRIFALFAMLALLLYLFLPDRRERRTILGLLLLIATPGYALTPARKGYESYRKEEYPTALRFYQKSLLNNTKNEKSKFGESATLYKMERSERAESGFLALTNSPNKKRGLSALYNVGNAQVQGKKLDEALQSYAEILKQLPATDKLYKKAMNNYLYVLNQKKKQEEQEKKEKPKGGQGQEQDKKDQKPEQGSEQKDNDNNNEAKAQQEQGQEAQEDKTPSKPISPNEVQNLLGVAQAEEKQNMKRQNAKKGKGVIQQNKY